jgi:hypothetical protein
MRMLSSRTGKHRQQGRTSRLAVSAPAQLVTITDWMGTAHLVTDQAMKPGDQGTGWYAAVCGVEVLAASLSAPIGRSCRGCASWIFAWRRGLVSGL